jgi:hypothetical protein
MVFNRGTSPAPIFPKGDGAASVRQLAEGYFFCRLGNDPLRSFNNKKAAQLLSELKKINEFKFKLS